MPIRSQMIAAALVGLLLLPAAVARVAAQDDAAGELPHVLFIWQEIVVLQTCNEIGLTSTQAAEAAEAIAPAFLELRQIWEQENSPQMREALTRLRDELVRGWPPPIAAWIEVAQVRGTLGVEEGDEDPIERRKAELAHDIGMVLLGVLTEQQIAHLAELADDEHAVDPEVVRMRALNKLSEWAETRRLVELFEQMVAADRRVTGPN